jgi:hypothetical protein
MDFYDLDWSYSEHDTYHSGVDPDERVVTQSEEIVANSRTQFRNLQSREFPAKNITNTGENRNRWHIGVEAFKLFKIFP